MSPTFDFTKADEKGGDFTAMPKGNYKAEIAEIDDERRTSENARVFVDAPMTTIKFDILEEGYDNRSVWLNLIFPEEGKDYEKQVARSAGKVKQLCRASGNWDDEAIEAADFNLDWDDLLGAKFTLKLTVQKGGDGNNIAAILPYDDTDDDEDDLP
jgi:hypothetical protein